MKQCVMGIDGGERMEGDRIAQWKADCPRSAQVYNGLLRHGGHRNPDLDDACEKIKEAEGCLRCALMKELLGADDETARYACDHCGGSVMKALEIARKRMSAGRR